MYKQLIIQHPRTRTYLSLSWQRQREREKMKNFPLYFMCLFMERGRTILVRFDKVINYFVCGCMLHTRSSVFEWKQWIIWKPKYQNVWCLHLNYMNWKWMTVRWIKVEKSKIEVIVNFWSRECWMVNGIAALEVNYSIIWLNINTFKSVTISHRINLMCYSYCHCLSILFDPFAFYILHFTFHRQCDVCALLLFYSIRCISQLIHL